MPEVCSCGRVGELEEPEPILVGGDGNTALRCPECGHTDRLEWLPALTRWPVFKETYQRRTTLRLPAARGPLPGA
jgi:hypothetical protein